MYSTITESEISKLGLEATARLHKRGFEDITFSDEEEEEGDDQTGLSKCTTWYLMELKFGKYIGEALPAMITSRRKRNYLRWVHKTPWLEKWQKKFISEALDHYEKQKIRDRKSVV